MTVAGLLGLATALVIGLGMEQTQGAPQRSELAQSEGELAWYGVTSKRVQFRLRDDERTFEYPKLAGRLSDVRRAVREGIGKQAQVLHEKEPYRPYFVMDERYRVVELYIGGAPVREWNQVDEAYRENSARGPWVALLIGAAALCVLFSASRMPSVSAA